MNRFEIHESSHQPLADMAPGMTLGPYGLWFNRNQTWAIQAGPWVTYLARCSYTLQQGHYYGDVAYFYGEEGPLTAVFGWKGQHDAPEGYGFRLCQQRCCLASAFSERRKACNSWWDELSDSLSWRKKPAHDATGT